MKRLLVSISIVVLLALNFQPSGVTAFDSPLPETATKNEQFFSPLPTPTARAALPFRFPLKLRLIRMY